MFPVPVPEVVMRNVPVVPDSTACAVVTPSVTYGTSLLSVIVTVASPAVPMTYLSEARKYSRTVCAGSPMASSTGVMTTLPATAPAGMVSWPGTAK